MKYPETILNLIECFKKYPSIGEKTAERLALSTLDLPDDVIKLFYKSFYDVKDKIKKCKKCNNLTEDEICDICKDYNRDNDILCIVENAKYINLMEKNNIFKGKYFVLNSLISPSKGLDTSTIEIDRIIQIINDNNVKEVIMALKPSIEGETTALYISKLLEDYDVVVSRIARGIPNGAEIDYVDSLTLEMAIENRNIISDK